MKKAPVFALAVAAVLSHVPAGADPINRPILFPNPAVTLQGVNLLTGLPVAVGDIDGNGLPDMAVVQFSRISIFLGTGGGAFTSGPPVTSGLDPKGIQLADLDGDGDADMVELDHWQILVRRSAGNGTFLSPSIINWSTPGFKLGDIDGDGDLDIVVTEYSGGGGGGGLRVSFNPGNGVFTDPVFVPLPQSNGTEFADVVDFNHDAYPDLMAAGKTFLGGAGLQFANPVQTQAGGGEFSDIADFNSDGFPDFVTRNTTLVGVYFGDAAGHLTLVNSFSVPYGQRVKAFDFDGDGFPDLAEEVEHVYASNLTGTLSTVRISRGLGNGQFTPVLDIPADSSDGLQAADMDRDGRQDLLAVAHLTVGLLLNGPDHLFGQRRMGTAPSGPIFVRDVNEDGIDDLLTAGDSISFFAGLPGGGFGAQQSFPGAPPDPGATSPGHRATLLDGNGDGHLDAAITSESFTALSPGAGNGAFGPVSTLSGGERHDGIVALDLGHDGDEDILLACLQSSCVLQAAGGGYPMYYRVPVPSGFKNMVAGDMNGDGTPDLIGTVDGRYPLVEFNPGQPQSLHIMLGGPDGSFVDGDSISIPQWKGRPTRLAVGDMNEDGRLDVLFYQRDAGLGLVLGTGNGHLAAPAVFPTAGTGAALWADLAVTDFDGDGHLDVAVLGHFDFEAHLLEIFMGSGTGAFPRQQAFVGIDAALRFDDPRLALGEFNGDGLPDLAFASQAGAVSLLLSQVGAGAPGHGPVAMAGADVFVECTSPSGGTATLDGSFSTDPDSTPGTNDDIVGYEWKLIDGQQETVLGATPQISAPLGMGNYLLTLRVTDRAGLSSTDSAVVIVRDTTPPVITALASQPVLWPPNHRMVQVSVATSVADLCGPATGLNFRGASSSEPDDATGDGDGRTTGDMQVASPGGLPSSFSFRAERDSGGPGRAYTLTYQAVDAFGNVRTQPVTLSVPHDIGGITEPVTLRMAETFQGTRVEWNAVPGARWYNVMGGILSDLRALPQMGSTGTCLGSKITGLDNSGFEVSLAPEVGEAFYFLVEYDDGRPSGYGTESAPYDRTRVAPSSLCP